jgi:5-methylcytosine-specific restriction endonuclease McrA
MDNQYRIRKQAYEDYLVSAEWQAIKERALRAALFSCEQCGSKPPLEVHHKTYTNLGHEQIEDLKVLCPACHENERLPRNRRKAELELHGQMRLFERWDMGGLFDWPVDPAA